MITDKKTVVSIFTMPQQFPCGPQSSCCGPIGQSEDVIKDLTEAISRELKCQVEILNVMDKNQMKNHNAVARIIDSFGPGALPIIVINDDVVSMGNPAPGETIAALKEKLKG